MMLGHGPEDRHRLAAAAAVDARGGGRARGQGRAAGVEAAAARDPGRVGRLAGEDLGLQVVDLGDHREQRPGVGMAGVGQHGLGRALLDDPAQVHDGQPVGDVPGQAEVVGDDQDGQAEVADQAEQQGQDLAPDRGVQAGHRLVGHQHARLQGQRPGDHHPLALAAGQLVGVGEEEPPRRAQAAAGQGLLDQRLLVALGTVDAQPLGHRLVHRLARVQGPGGVLEDQLDLAAVGLEGGGATADRLAPVQDLAAGRLDQA